MLLSRIDFAAGADCEMEHTCMLGMLVMDASSWSPLYELTGAVALGFDHLSRRRWQKPG